MADNPYTSLKVDLSGQTALVTGASQGLGKACAIRLAENGATVICVARSADKLAATIAEIEKAMGKRAEKVMAPMQPGDVPATYADIGDSIRDLGFAPTTPISVGIPRFIAWFKEYYRV